MENVTSFFPIAAKITTRFTSQWLCNPHRDPPRVISSSAVQNVLFKMLTDTFFIDHPKKAQKYLRMYSCTCVLAGETLKHNAFL